MAIRLGALILASVLGLAGPAFCQDHLSLPVPLVDSDSPDRPTNSYREGLIHLDVSIADQAGNPIPLLGMPDLALLDGGKPANIRTLRPAWSSDINARLTEVTVVLDELNLSGILLARARSQLMDYLRRNHGVLPQPTSVFASPARDSTARM